MVAAGHQQSYRVNRVVLHDGRESHNVLFWYELNGRQVADPYRAKLWTIGDALYWRRTNGALVVVWTPSELAEDREKTLRVFV